ncbi:MAG: zinc-binding dehydrogenase [Pseudomonadota bacterium]|nr:MAG: alcohol dehydrogenase [Pseudomonadota bacterium]
MRAIVFHRHGGLEVLEEAEIPTPEPGPGEVRVQVRAVALNHLDLWVRKGLPGLNLEMPHILGSDIAGVVDKVGEKVEGLQPGLEVMVQPGLSCGRCEACLTGHDNDCPSYRIIGEHVRGGYAEYVVVPASNVVPKPPNLSFEEAAAIPLVFLTAWEMLVRKARVRPGERVLVQAAGSGVSSAAIQIAKLYGAEVIASASTEEKLQKARELGADHTVNYTRQDLVAEVRRIAGSKRGVEVVVDHVGEATWESSVRSLANGGRLVVCGATTGYDVRVDLRHLFYRRLELLGSTMGSKGDLHRIVRLVELGKLRPVVDRVLPLSEAREAHRLLAERKAFGKVVLRP